MRLPGVLSIAVLGAVVLDASPAFAQSRSSAPPPWVAIVSVNLGVQVGNPLEQVSELNKYVEPAPFTATVSKTLAPIFDGGVIVRAWKNLGVAGAVSFASDTGDAEVAAEIPHPFYFDRRRAIAGAASIGHAEMVVHANAAWLFDRPTLHVVVFGGVSFFKIGQDLVSDVIFDEQFPYDTATFVGADIERVEESTTGFNLGADVTWRLSARWGVGALVRYSRGELPLSVNGVDAGTLTVGGVAIGGGLRVVF
jgi:hypothetical protein